MKILQDSSIDSTLRHVGFVGFVVARCSILALGLAVGHIPALAEISFVDLHPAGAGSSRGIGVTASYEVGDVRFPDVDLHAALWSGSAASFVDLNPTGALASSCLGAGGTQQVGFAVVRVGGGAYSHAALWTGTAESFRDLHPPWAGGPAGVSQADHTTGSQQTGRVGVPSGFMHAAIWHGSAEESVDLGIPRSPAEGLCPPSFNGADVRVVTESSQAGYVILGDDLLPPLPGGAANYKRFAALWHGTAESFVNLHPSVATGNSEVQAACGPYQAGFVVINGIAHAALWSGSSNSFVDLHAALGSAYGSSSAQAIWTDGVTTRVVGTAGDHAILWTIQAPRVEVTSNRDGLQLSWSSADLGFAVERASTLGSGCWEAVAPSPSLKEGKWTLTLPFPAGTYYFRLRR